MNGSDLSSWANKFSHIYVEEDAYKYALTERILKRFGGAEKIPIKCYKEVFNRSGQNFRLQKRSSKLILAVKKGNFLYPGSDLSQSFGYRNFYYNALILNCIYDCQYCYLQGMYPSANIVLFVNLDDFFEATREAVGGRPYKSEPLYLCVSYDTDLLALEPVAPYSSLWIEFARTCGDLLIEIRTKSANYKRISSLEPTPQVILAWTLSPESVAKAYEKGAPPLPGRIRAIKEALNDGWQVRLCFDPVLRVDGWREKYSELIEQTFAQLPAEKIHSVSLGVFRMNSNHFHRIKKQRPLSDILYHPFEVKNGNVSYPYPQRREMMEVMLEKLLRHLPEGKIAPWA